MKKSDRRSSVFCTIAAQHDNLGDIVIRQRMLDLITSSDAHVHISVGKMPRQYIDAFDLPENSTTYPSTVRFIRSFLTSALRARTSVVFPPGPYPLSSWRSAGRGLLAVAMSLVARSTGGASVTVGKSVRGNHRGARAVEKLLIRISNVYIARDLLSAAAIGSPVPAAPDLALLAKPSDSDTPKILALSFRSDRPLALDFLRPVIEWARSREFVPVFVTQVARDEARHAEQARALGVDHLAWGTKSHREQLSAITTLYAETSIVVTDRLHAALLGVLGGAVPVAVRQGTSPSKIADALDGVLPYASVDRSSVSDIACALETAASSHAAVTMARAGAQERLQSVQADIRRAMTQKSDSSTG